MYEAYYGFSERPFSLLPDPDFLFPSSKHQAALDTLELAIHNQSAFCILSGEIGAGKTTLLRELLNRLDDDLCVGLVSNTHPSFGELLQWIAAAFDLPAGDCDKTTLHERFVDFVIAQYGANKRTLLVVDEAQNLSTEALEELRMLSNVNSDKDFVLQILLVGQPQLRDNLRRPDLRQFAQRIALDYHLDALDAGETSAYIRHRLRHAGARGELFSDAACRAVAGYAMGVPRLINRLCDLALVYGFAEQQQTIEAGLVERVARDDGRLSPIKRPPTEEAPAAGDVSSTGESLARADQSCRDSESGAIHSQAVAPHERTAPASSRSGVEPSAPGAPAAEPVRAQGPRRRPPAMVPDQALEHFPATAPSEEVTAPLELDLHPEPMPLEVDLYQLFADTELRVPGWKRRRRQSPRPTRWVGLLVLIAVGVIGAVTHDSWMAPTRDWAGQFATRAWAAGRALMGLEVLPRSGPETAATEDSRSAGAVK